MRSFYLFLTAFKGINIEVLIVIYCSAHPYKVAIPQNRLSAPLRKHLALSHLFVKWVSSGEFKFINKTLESNLWLHSWIDC